MTDRGLNVLNGLQISLGLLFHVVLFARLGASSAADSFFAAVAVVSVIATFASCICEQFIPHFLHAAKTSLQRSYELYQTTLFWILVVGVVCSVLTFALRDFIIVLVVPSFEFEQRLVTSDFLAILSINVLMLSLIKLNNLVFTATSRFSIQYYCSCIQHVCNIVAALLFYSYWGHKGLAGGVALGGVLTVTLQIALLRKLSKVPVGTRISDPAMIGLVHSGIVVSLGHQIYGLKDLLFTHFLAQFGQGAVSLFNYAWKVGGVVFTLTTAVVTQKLLPAATRAVTNRQGEIALAAIRDAVRRNSLGTAVVFGSVIVLGWALLQLSAISTLFPDIGQVFGLLCACAPYFFVLSLEIPFVQMVLAMRAGIVVVITACLFLCLLWLMLTTFEHVLTLYAVPGSVFVAQVVNAAIYVLYVRWVVRTW